jgi:hypothetical protein
MPRRMRAGKTDRAQLGVDVGAASLFRTGRHYTEGLSESPVVRHTPSLQMLILVMCPNRFAQRIAQGAQCGCEPGQMVGWFRMLG